MAFISKKDLKQLYTDAISEAQQWRESYPAFERLADNDLMEGLDPSLPEVNDGSLSAALFKLPKRIVNRKLTGTVKATDRDEAWLSELANLQWENEIIPHANTQAPFTRKWKDAVRKAAIYGSVPLITLIIEKDEKTYVDFIVAQPQDVKLEPGKVSDYDSDVIFWDVYYSKSQLETIIEQAKSETKSNNPDSYNKWDVESLEAILKGDFKDERDPKDTPRQSQTKDVKPKGFKFCIAFQRGVNAPFYMYHKESNKTVREWSNPDPTGDVPVHFLYCYQDFINPYGIGIVKLAGGTQNVLDYMRQADVLATQLGLRPPIKISGNADDVDIDSLVYAQDALWFTGNAQVERMEMANQVYGQLLERQSAYKTSLNQLIPTGDTSIATGSGDPQYSKTPAGVKFQAASLSIDDEDFKDNLYVTYEAVAKSMINTLFATMEGSDLMKVSDDERELLMKGGLEFAPNEMGELSNEVELMWDDLRANFSFEVDPEQDKAADEAQRLEGLTRVAELVAADPNLDAELMQAGKKLNKGELFAEIIQLTSDNDKIITDISPDDEAAMAEQAPQGGQQQGDPVMEQQIQQSDEKHQLDMQAKQQDMELKAQKAMPQMPEMQQEPEQPPEPPISQEEVEANVNALMEEYGIDEETALTALAAEKQGYPPEDVVAYLQKLQGATA